MNARQFFKTCLLSATFMVVAGPNGSSQNRPTAPAQTVDSAAAPKTTLAITPIAALPVKTLNIPDADTIYDKTGERLADNNAKYASIAIDETGTVLSGTNIDKKLYPASVTKILTAYMVFQAIEDGKLTLDQKVRMSAHAASMEASNLNIKAGEMITVETLLKALMVKSANDAAVGLAEAVSGTHSAFVADMNKVALEVIGMKGSNFVNANGLPYNVNGNRNFKSTTTVGDMALLMASFIKKFPEQYKKYFSLKSFSFDGKTTNNHNKFLPGVSLSAKDKKKGIKQYAGMDGGKTGYTESSGCNIVCSAVRNGQRVIVVTFGHKTGMNRGNDLTRLFDNGFAKLAKLAVGGPDGYQQMTGKKMDNPLKTITAATGPEVFKVPDHMLRPKMFSGLSGNPHRR